jgi:hypothetical protein
VLFNGIGVTAYWMDLGLCTSLSFFIFFLKLDGVEVRQPMTILDEVETGRKLDELRKAGYTIERHDNRINVARV